MRVVFLALALILANVLAPWSSAFAAGHATHAVPSTHHCHDPAGANKSAKRSETMSKHTCTAVREDGLRYASKLGGSPFQGSGQTRSCFKCGRHRPPSSLQSKRILARTELGCKPASGPKT